MFLQSKSVNSVCKLLQILADFAPDSLQGLRPWTPMGDFRPRPRGLLGYRPSPQLKIPVVATEDHSRNTVTRPQFTRLRDQ